MDTSSAARAFYQYLDQQGVDLVTSMGTTQLSKDFHLRGVVALKDIAPKQDLVNIPYECAINLGLQGADPVPPALEFLKSYCREGQDGRKAYYELLPGFTGDDCLGSTNFFSDRALQELQYPMMVDETLERRHRVQQAYDRLGNDMKWIDGSPLTMDQLLWAVWLITSRVLTVQGDEGQSYRLLIPYLDMCNHDRKSPHLLTGRAVPGGSLKVVAQSPVKKGAPATICYGGGVEGNDRFLQDYGFLDASEEAYTLTAQQLLGKRRITGGVNAGKSVTMADRDRTLDALRQTTVSEDRQLLASETDRQVQSAIQFRLNLKLALSKYIDI